MPSSRDDFLLRAAKQLATALARAGELRGAGQLEEARNEVERAQQEQYGPLLALLPQVDPATAAGMLGGADRVFGWARLLAEQAEIERAAGRVEAAERLERRTLELLLETQPRTDLERRELRAWVAELAARVDPGLLSPAHRAALAEAGHGGGAG